MNKIVKEHYPAHKLPVELREGMDPNAHVTVTVVPEEGPGERALSLEEIFAARRPPYLTAEEIDEKVSRRRDEWDE